MREGEGIGYYPLLKGYNENLRSKGKDTHQGNWGYKQFASDQELILDYKYMFNCSSF